MRHSTSRVIARFILCRLVTPLAAVAQSAKVPRIGFLSAIPVTERSEAVEACRQGLRDLGYVEGQNLTIEYRSAEGKYDRLPGLAAELVREQVDLIVTAGPLRAGRGRS
jgi:putative ABC transport system substrate-binding protein